MKNLFSLITLSTLLFFASCSKEAIVKPQISDTTDIQMVGKITDDTTINGPIVNTSNADGSGINVIISSHFSIPTELNIYFTSSHNFTDGVIEPTQTLEFVDGNGNTVTLTFGVNSYTGGNGTLAVSLAIGGNDLTGLGVKASQVIVEDVIMN